ncbi:MAG: hypothetical protein ACYTX0_53870 [Nostoc sp.]
MASVVRLQMHGEIKLKNWIPFKAEQVICWKRGLIWNATAWMNGLPRVFRPKNRKMTKTSYPKKWLAQ